MYLNKILQEIYMQSKICFQTPKLELSFMDEPEIGCYSNPHLCLTKPTLPTQLNYKQTQQRKCGEEAEAQTQGPSYNNKVE